jgi:two-component system, OmpR family, sensor histidine kinase TctE
VRGSPSLVRRLLWALVGSLTAVALVLGTGGAWLINGIVESTADRLLGASARAIAETLAVEEGQITLDLPPFALGMLENNARDNVYYSVRRNGELVTGYPDLASVAPSGLDLEESNFRYERYRGARVRVVAEARRLPRIDGTIVVQVAETLDARRDLARRMLLGLAILEAVLVGVAALLVWPAVRWSLGPVTRLRQTMDARSATRADFTPLPVEGVPSELAGLVVGFNALLQRLEASVEGTRRFTADASHQMRTPLAVLRTHLALLRKHGTGSEIGRASLADVELATNRLQGLLTGLLALARADEGVPLDQGATVDVRKIARRVVTELAPSAAVAKVNLRSAAPQQPVHAAANPILLAELLGNLVENAIRYNRKGGWVEVVVANDHDGPLIQVTDNGPGIPAEERERVFERFYRLPRDQKHAGSGLGLSIAAGLSRQLPAELRLEDGPGGKGLRAVVRLSPPRAA